YSGGIERQIHEKVAPPMSVRREDLGITSSVTIPAHWEECVADCLAKDPARRPASAAELSARLRGESVQRAVPVIMPVAAPPAPKPVPGPAIPPTPAPLPPPPAQSPRGLQSNRVFYGGLAAIAILLLGGIAIFLATRPSEETPPAREQATPIAVAAQPSASPIATPAPSVRSTSSPAVIAVASPTTAPATPAATVSRPPASVTSFPASAGYDPTVALVDMNRIFKEYNKTKESEKKVNDSKDAAKKEYDQRADAYKKALDELNALGSNARARDDKIAKIKTMEREINEFRQTREKQLQEEAMRMRDQIVKEITQEIAALDSSNTQLVFDRSGLSTNSIAFIVSAPVSSDVSDKIVSGLNKKARSSFAGTQGHTVGLVDMNAIFKAYDKTKASETKINEAKDAAKKEYDDRSETYKKALEEVNALSARVDALSTNAPGRASLVKERDQKIAAVKNLEREINEFRQTRERQLQEQALRMRENIVKEIDDAIRQSLTQSNANPLLFDISGTSSNGVPIIVYHKGIPDFSTDIVAGMNARSAVRLQQPFAKSKSLRFAAVDMNRLFKGWPETKTSEAKINASKELAKKEYDDRAEAYKKALEEINTLNQQLESSSLSADAKTAKAKERDAKITAIKRMEKEINDFRTGREKQLQDEALKLREAIVAKMTAAVKSRAEAEGFNVVFDSTGPSLNGVPLLVIPPGVPDLTDSLLKQ
ncbi:MAG TPA: OmpH family outer membrane protein, partial [Chthoniobacterales bacterium]